MILSKLIYSKFFLLVISIFFSSQFTFSQTLIMNEVSNGTSGNQEYVEFIVVDATATYDCNQITPPCIDIRGWIFDDNSGYHGAVGVAAGAVRFSFDPLWSCVPLGTIIVIHNDGDPNPAMPANDLSMADGNCRIIAPISSLTLFEKNSTTPGAIACSYPATGWVAGGTWSNTLFANTGDCARIVDLAGCEVFSVCYATANTNNLIYFSSGGSGGQNVWFFNGGNPTLQANWSEGSASPSPGQQTPGVANNAANAAYISQFNNSCTPITPIIVNAVSTNAGCVCDGTATATASGSIGGYTYVWYDVSFIPIGQTSANATGLCAGTYNVIATSSIGCPDTTQVVITNSGGAPNTTITPAGPFCQSAASVNLTAATGGGTWSGTGITNTATGTFNPATAGAGTFTITYSIGGACPGSSTTAITVNPPTIPTFAVIAPICSGGTIILPTTSTNGITGTWSPAINNLATTTYTFTPTAGQCATTTTITVNVGSPVTPVFTAIAPICNGDAIILATTSNDGFTGTWSPAINNTATTTYTFTPTLGQCATTTTMTVTVNAPTVPTFTAIAPICSGGTISLLTTSTNGITGTWSPAINNAATTTYTFTPSLGQCATTTTLTVTVNTPTVPTFTAIAPICSGGTITLLTTSTNGITGIWSPAINNTATTTYTFTPSVGQCATNTTMTVSVNTPTVPTFTAIAPICSGGTINLLTTSTNGITGTWSPVIDNTTTTTYTFTPTLGQCATTTTLTVNVGAPAIPVFTQVATICSGGTFTLPTTSVDGFAGTWSPVIDNTTTTTYTFTPTVGQCATTTIMTVTVNAPTVPTFTAIAAICTGGSFTLPTISINGFTGTWSPSIDNTTTTTYTFTPDLGQCASTNTLTVAVNPIPVVDPIANQNVCNGDPILASNFTSSPTGSLLDWTNSNTGIGLATSGSGNTPAFNAINGTGSSISGTVSVIPTLNGCVGNALAFSITVNDQLNATITPVGPFCESNTSIILTAVDAGGTWTGNGITNSTNGTFDPFSAGVGTHIITYTISGSCGDIQTTSIIVNPDLDATINAAGPFCTNDPAIALSAVDAGGTWSGTGITNASLGIFDPSIANIGVNTVTYTISGACGDIQSINIIVTDQLDASISPVANVCQQDPSFNLSAVDPGGIWSGTGITNFTLGTFDPAIAGIGTHTITYTISGSCGDTQTTSITVLNNADATISPVGPLCLTSPSLLLTSVDPGGIWTGNGITNALTGTFDPLIAGVGTHLITYTISGQCGDVNTILLTVTGLLNSTINPVGALCENALPFNFTPATSGGVWSGTGITNSVTGTFDPNAAGVGTHTITYTLPGICGSASSLDIIVNPLPIADFTLDNVSGCVPLSVTFTDQSTPSGGNLNWIISDGFSSNSSGTISHTFNSAGCFDVTLEYTSSQGCISTLTQNNIICVDDIPQAEFSWSPNDVTILNPLVNFYNESIGATLYDWDFAGLGNSVQTNPSYLFAKDVPGTYEVCLSATNALGCIDTVCHVIVIEDEFIVYVPNAFTPDQDGNNEIFIPIISGHDPEEYEFMIFNRWGELIFISENSNSGWDGSYKGWSSKEDVYVWKLNVKEANNNKQHNLVGHLSLLR